MTRDPEEHLRRLGDRFVDASITDRVMRRVAASDTSTRRRNDRAWRWCAAAGLVLAGAVGWSILGDPQNAVAVDVPEQTAVFELDGLRAEVRFMIAIADDAVLVCWTADGRNESDPPRDGPRYRYHPVRIDLAADGTRWRWGLFIANVAQSIHKHPPALRLAAGNGATMSVSGNPVGVDHDRLAPLVLAAQRTTLPAGASEDRIVPLAQLLSLRNTNNR